ncbi:hypothetical protein F5J12DRAFT_895616 [Pisolithus orientalis]|uniref:uncharacterized protein n=1 Tax=Pisolithus orientalis TaxID=936130 RepID=UPI0022243AF2|nr:uncharacterized protein F5J12DRAFT_895616 [Pisolithus orientalis]KAI5998423.1 hypothetical protein F5J12DRAFT_895616 [Pisolithus orientalis]
MVAKYIIVSAQLKLSHNFNPFPLIINPFYCSNHVCELCPPTLPAHTCTNPDPAEAEKASLKEQNMVALAGLMEEAKYVPNDWEDMQEEKTTWLRHCEEKTAVLMPLVEQGKVLGVSMQVNAEDAPVLAEADDLYKQWTAEEAKACAKAKQDVQMGEEAAVELGDDSAVKMSHVEVLQPTCKKSQQAIAESDNDERSKASIPPGSVLHAVP